MPLKALDWEKNLVISQALGQGWQDKAISEEHLANTTITYLGAGMGYDGLY